MRFLQGYDGYSELCMGWLRGRQLPKLGIKVTALKRRWCRRGAGWMEPAECSYQIRPVDCCAAMFPFVVGNVAIDRNQSGDETHGG